MDETHVQLRKEGVNIKHISLNVSEEIKYILPDTLEKDLQDNELICPICHGLGVVLDNHIYGIKCDTSETSKKSMFPYNHQAIKFCPRCYNGVIKLCEYCGNPLPKGTNRCNCADYLKKEREEYKIKYHDTITKAKEINIKDITYYMYDERSEKYFSDEDEFVEYYWENYLDGSGGCNHFDEYFEYEVPKVLWNCEEVKMTMDADSIIDDACEELHEDARDNISYEDEKELQKFLNDWCAKQTGTTTYYPCYKEYVRVQKEWFDQCTKN